VYLVASSIILQGAAPRIQKPPSQCPEPPVARKLGLSLADQGPLKPRPGIMIGGTSETILFSAEPRCLSLIGNRLQLGLYLHTMPIGIATLI
jgi:hypothetical protein